MKAIVNGIIVLKDAIREGDAVCFEDGKITAVCHETELPENIERIDAQGNYVLPGLIDMHIHGYLGADASDGEADGIVKMAEGVAKNGVTAFLPTTMTVSYESLEKAFDAVRSVMKKGTNGAEILGVNAEGPFINVSKKGAQAGEHVRKGDAAFLKRNADLIRVFTVAPEVEGNLNCIREISKDTDMLISMGHTAATYEEAEAGIDAGVRHVTHLFNAQTGMNHRAPGVVGAALSDNRVSCELIADTFHVHKGLFPMVARAKGEKLVLITDCTRAGGLPDGEYTLGGQPIFVRGIECRLADGTIAGSVLRLNEAVRNVRNNTDLPIFEVVNMASLNVAKRLRIDDRKGSLEVSKDADIVIADKNFDIKQTFVKGQNVYTKL